VSEILAGKHNITYFKRSGLYEHCSYISKLANMNYLVEEWGGKYQCQEIAAKKGLNIEELLPDCTSTVATYPRPLSKDDSMIEPVAFL